MEMLATAKRVSRWPEKVMAMTQSGCSSDLLHTQRWGWAGRGLMFGLTSSLCFTGYARVWVSLHCKI